jgi:hypothetical protein
MASLERRATRATKARRAIQEKSDHKGKLARRANLELDYHVEFPLTSTGPH